MTIKHEISKAFAGLSLVALCALGSQAWSVAAVNLGGAGNFTILAKTGISTVGTTSIVGNVGLSPAAASFITGFGLIADPSNQFSTSSLVNGEIFAADYAAPTPSIMTTSIADMQTAYTDAAGRAAGVTGLGAGNIGGLTLAPNVYQWGTAVTIPTNLTLSGDSNAVWIFQIAQTLDISSAAQIVLIGGAQAKNIFWQVAGQTTLGTTSIFYGNILDQTLIAMNTGATLNGKALAQTAVTLQANSVVSSISGYFGPNPPQPGRTFAYPSPVKGSQVTMVYNMASPGTATLQVWNENGDLVATQKQQKQEGSQKTQISVASFAPGVYLYRIEMAYDSGSTERLDAVKFSVIK